MMSAFSRFLRTVWRWIGTEPWQRAHDVLWVALLLVALGVNVSNWLELYSAEEFRLGALLHDDAYYYLMIAQNIVRGNGITFDGLHPTTGFQPLYQVITVGLTALEARSQISIFRWIFTLNLLFASISAAVIVRMIRREGGAFARWSVVLPVLMLPLNFPLVFKRLGAGMEMGISLLLLSLWLQVLCSPSLRVHDMRSRLLEGLLLGTLTMTRMDYSILGLIYAIYLVCAWRARVANQLAALIAGYSIPIGLYAILAWHWMDSLVPVSFLVKQYYSSQHLAMITPAEHLWYLMEGLAKIWLYPVGYLLYGLYWRWQIVGLGVGGAAVALLAAWLAVDRRRELRTGLASSGLRWFGLACLAHALVLAWSGPGYISSAYFWYFTPELLVLVMGLSVVFAKAHNTSKPVHGVAAWLLAVVFVASIAAYDVDKDMESYASYRAMIERVRQLTPDSARIGSWDAGFNAYWLRPRIVLNLDGMVNSRAYLEQVIKPGDYMGYFAAERIGYLLNMTPNTEAQQFNVQNRYFRHTSVPRSCYDVMAVMPFDRQGLTVYLLRLKCLTKP